MTTSQALLAVLLAIFALPWLVWRLGRTDAYAPLVVVQIIGGVLLGPGVAGAIAPGPWRAIFQPRVIDGLGAIGQWAVMMYVWTAGLELDLRGLWRHRRDTAVTGALALGGPLLAGAAAAAALMGLPGFLGPRAHPAQAVAGVGMACAVTALPILVLLMEKMQILRAPLGQRILRYASLDDVAIWGVLALILFDVHRLVWQAAFLAAFVPAALGVRALFRRVGPVDRWPLALVWLAACGLAADAAGLHYMVGAFLAGAALDADLFAEDALSAFRGGLLLTIMPVFFLSTGLKTQWGAGGWAEAGAAALLLAAAVGGKLAGLSLAGRLLGWAPQEAALVGWLLQTKGLIMIIFANILLDRGVIGAAAFTALLLMAVASTMIATPMVNRRLRLEPGLIDAG